MVRAAVKNEILKTVNSGSGSFWANGTADAKVGLIGCEKDHTSYYLKKFPEWGSVGVKFINPLNATDIRRAYFIGGQNWENVKLSRHLDPAVVNVLETLRLSDGFNYVMGEIEFNRRHAEMWKNSPYTPSFNTADSMVVQSGHVLLVRRKSFPGKGLLALPGGYKNPDETLYQTALRELREETKLKIPEKVLRGSLVHNQVFDDPHRSGRGQIVTQAYLFQLEDMEELPRVKGHDDADKAFWVPLDSLKEEDFFEDHYHIVQYLKSFLT
jgi:bifunctional NMN adenylyltransferase/nudix hydrolase